MPAVPRTSPLTTAPGPARPLPCESALYALWGGGGAHELQRVRLVLQKGPHHTVLQVLSQGTEPGPSLLLLQGGEHRGAPGGPGLSQWGLAALHLHAHPGMSVPGERVPNPGDPGAACQPQAPGQGVSSLRAHRLTHHPLALPLPLLGFLSADIYFLSLSDVCYLIINSCRGAVLVWSELVACGRLGLCV